ncbi:MAG: hypothetical protein ACI8UX_002037, partial [Psychromonas sp.]
YHIYQIWPPWIVDRLRRQFSKSKKFWVAAAQ